MRIYMLKSRSFQNARAYCTWVPAVEPIKGHPKTKTMDPDVYLINFRGTNPKYIF